MKKTIHFYISGRVQGVCYRMSACQQAGRLGVTGWVRNLADGRVEVLATAEQKVLDDFRTWLSRGPALAKVLNVESNTVELQEFEEFLIH